MYVLLLVLPRFLLSSHNYHIFWIYWIQVFVYEMKKVVEKSFYIINYLSDYYYYYYLFFKWSCCLK